MDLDFLRRFAYFSSFRDQIPASCSALFQFPRLGAETRCGVCVRRAGGGDLPQRQTKINLLIFPLQSLSLADRITLYFLYIYLPAEDVLG